MLRLLIALALLVTAAPASAHAQAAEAPARVLLLDGPALLDARHGQISADELSAVRQRADVALQRGPFTVTAKRVPPPSGDVHDYVSLSIYWWPDPASSDGLPYIQRDGVRNTEADDVTRYDANPVTLMVSDVEALALAYYLTGDARYGAHAAQDLRTWFLDPETRMNPNFRFAQIIPGRDAIRGTGIIESRRFTRIVDSVALLADCACWTRADVDGLRAWFADFERWLRESPHGQMEARTTNNHAVWYDVQLVDFALFAGDVDSARAVLSSVGARRIDTQIAADGSMPRELERTRSLHYSNFNLQAFFELAVLAQTLGIDLWTYVNPDGAGLRSALDFLVPYLSSPSSWPYDEITEVDPFAESAATLKRAASVYPDGAYGDTLDAMSSRAKPVDQLRLRLGYWPD